VLGDGGGEGTGARALGGLGGGRFGGEGGQGRSGGRSQHGAEAPPPLRPTSRRGALGKPVVQHLGHQSPEGGHVVGGFATPTQAAQDRTALVGHDHVAGIDAAMGDPEVVKVGHRGGQRCGHARHLLRCQGPGITERSALHQPGAHHAIGGVDKLHHAGVGSCP